MESFTDSSIPPFLRRRLNDRSRIDLNALDLWGIAAIGEIFSWGGGLSLISSHRTSFACPTLTTESARVLQEIGTIGEALEPLLPTSPLLTSLPVFVGHPSCDHFDNSSPTRCAVAMPAGHISLRYSSGRSCLGGRETCPVWVDHSVIGICSSCSAWRRLLFCNLSLSVSAPVKSPPV